jgi:hypothetical protein
MEDDLKKMEDKLKRIDRRKSKKEDGQKKNGR